MATPGNRRFRTSTTSAVSSTESGVWVVYLIHGTLFGIRGLVASGAPASDPALRRARRWLIERQRADGGWGESHEGCGRGEYTENQNKRVIQTAWALIALLEAQEPDWRCIERILQASMELFSARGFDRTSISQIAARSGVSRATIFWHFGNKATLFQETCRHFLVPFRQSLERSLIHLEPRARIVDQLAAYEHFVTENSTTIHAFISWVFSSPEPADSLRRELLALHTAYVASIERSLGELLDDPREAGELTTTLVSLLHGNMLLALCGAPESSGPIERGIVLKKLLDRALANVPHQRR